MFKRKCPVCNEGTILPDDQQPQPGTHAYTIVFDCGTEIDYAYGDDNPEDVEPSHKCTDGKKQSMKEMLDEMFKNSQKRKFDEMTFQIHDCPQTEIAMYHEMLGYMVKAMDESTQLDDRRGTRIIKAPELMKAVMHGGRGHFNPSLVVDLIKNLHKGTL